MIAKSELAGLVGYEGDLPVLSVYLDTDLSDKSKDGVKLMLRQRLKGMDREPQAGDVERVFRFLDYEYDWQPRGVAIFAAGDALWRTIPLPISVPARAYCSTKPVVRTLMDVVDRFGRYAVALVDREALRLFAVEGGKITPLSEVVGEELKHHRQGGWAAARYQRHEDHLALHNLKQAIEVVDHYMEDHDLVRWVLGGSEEVLAQVKGLLPSRLRRGLIGEFPVNMAARPAEVLQRSLDIAMEADTREEQQLVQEAITAANKGGAGVIGLADSLYALQEGRVQSLLVDEALSASGTMCAHCEYIAPHLGGACPFCGGTEFHEVADAVNRAIHKAIDGGADVNIVRENEALREAGGIAALLRY
ncbi:MAG: Vms1/Ankzf1 family peptidyl-tRNA hydrolase [Anaerolineae bacterium]